MTPLRHPLRQQLGYYMLNMAVVLLVTGMAVLGNARSSMNGLQDSLGQKLGSDLETVRVGLNAYMKRYNDALRTNSTIAGVATPAHPTVAELGALQLLRSNVADTPLRGGAYVTNIWPIVDGTNQMVLRGSVSLRDPVIDTKADTTNTRALWAAAEASASREIGFSKIDVPAFKQAQSVYFPTGLTAPNPDATRRAGILYASAADNTVPTLFWQAPVTQAALLPAQSTVFDGRLARNSHRPFAFDGVNTTLNAGWRELFTTGLKSTHVSLGQGAGRETPSSPMTMRNNVHVGPYAGASSGLEQPSAYVGNSADNVLVGNQAGTSSFGATNVFMGHQAGRDDYSGTTNTYVGAQAGLFNSWSADAVLAGYQAGYNYYASRYVPRVALGAYASSSITPSGSDLLSVGTNAGRNLTSGTRNVFYGKDAGRFETSTHQSVYMGHQAGGNGDSRSTTNVFVGYGAKGASSSYSFSGVLLGANTGTGPTFAGSGVVLAGASACQAANVFFSNTTCVGAKAGRNITQPSTTTLVGAEAGMNSTDTYVTLIGYQAGRDLLGGGGRNTFVGSRAAMSTTTSGINIAFGKDTTIANDISMSAAIGYGASVSSPRTIQLGNGAITTVRGAVPWSTASDRRLKENIQDTPRGLDFVRQLRPVDYTLISNHKKDTGFIAQEVEGLDATFPGVIAPQNAQDHYSLSYTSFIPAMVSAIQTLDRHPKAPSARSWQKAALQGGLCAMLLGLSAAVAWLLQHNYRLMNELAVLRRTLCNHSPTLAL